MTDHHETPPLLLTSIQVLRITNAVIFTRHHLLPFLFLSFLLFGFRVQMEKNTHFLTSFIDNDPSIKSLFTTPVIFDSFNTQLGLSNASNHHQIEHQDSSTWSALHAFISFLLHYGFMVLMYLFSQSFIHGVVFVLVVQYILEIRIPVLYMYRKGTILGLNRLASLILLKWGLMHSLVQIMSFWFVGNEDKYSVIKILIRLKFLPFSVGLNSVMEGFEEEIYGFLLTYFTLDLFISYVFAVCVWVVLADSTKDSTKRTHREVIREGFYLLSLSINPAIYLKSLENIVSALFTKFIIPQVCGELLASFIQSFMVIYFMVAWMMYYFCLKSMDAISRGLPFGQKEFIDMINDHS